MDANQLNKFFSSSCFSRLGTALLEPAFAHLSCWWTFQTLWRLDLDPVSVATVSLSDWSWSWYDLSCQTHFWYQPSDKSKTTFRDISQLAGIRQEQWRGIVETIFRINSPRLAPATCHYVQSRQWSYQDIRLVTQRVVQNFTTWPCLWS